MTAPISSISLTNVGQIQAGNNPAYETPNKPSASMSVGGETQLSQMSNPAPISISKPSVRAADLVTNQPSNPMNDGAFGNMMLNVREVVSNVKVDKAEIASKVKISSADEIKAQMIPAYELEGAPKQIDSSNNAIAAMSKTFDHAMFVAMVTQVASGVSNSLRMLVRQS